MSNDMNRRIKKQDNINILLSKKFQRRLGKVPVEDRAVIKALSMDQSDRKASDEKALINFFKEVKCIKDLKLSD